MNYRQIAEHFGDSYKAITNGYVFHCPLCRKDNLAVFDNGYYATISCASCGNTTETVLRILRAVGLAADDLRYDMNFLDNMILDVVRRIESYTGAQARKIGSSYRLACPICDAQGKSRHLAVSKGRKNIIFTCYKNIKDLEHTRAILASIGLTFNDVSFTPPIGQKQQSSRTKEQTQKPPQKVHTQPITQRVNRGKRSEDRRHMYMDANGNKLALKTIYRYEDGSKDALWYAYNPDLKRISSYPGLGGMEIPFYRMERLAQFKGSAIVFVEGEKDADCIWKISKGKVVGTCLPNGAADTKWRPQYNFCFEGKNILILRDNDEPGERYAVGVAHNLRNIASKIRIINPAELEEALIGRKGADISDLVDAVGEDEAWSRIKQAVAVTPDYFEIDTAEEGGEQ